MAATGLSKLYSDHGSFPLQSSINVQPKLQMSALRPYFDYLIISGAIQGMLPFIKSLNFSYKQIDIVFSIFLEHPKSESFITPY